MFSNGLINDDFNDGPIGPNLDEFGNPISKSSKFVVKPGKFHNYRSHNNDRFLTDSCSVDVIIPFHCRFDLVRRVLQSVLWKTKSNPFLITLVDDGSPGAAANQFASHIAGAPNTNLIRLERQMGFGAAVNRGIRETRQPFICILHSDCQVKYNNWLQQLGDTLLSGEKRKIAMAVPLSNNPGDDGFDQIQCESFESYNGPKESLISDVPLPLFCCLMRREVIERVGLFKEYPFVGYENEELFYRLNYYGYKQAVCRRTWVHHELNATINYLTKRDANVPLEVDKNRDRCINDLRVLFGNATSNSHTMLSK